MTLSLLPHRPQVAKALPRLHQGELQGVEGRAAIDPVHLTSAIQRLAGERTSQPSLEELAALWNLAEGYRAERDAAVALAESFRKSCDARGVCIQELVSSIFGKGQG